MRLHTARTILLSTAIISLTTACKNNEPPSPPEQKEPATKFIMQGHFDQPEVCVNIGPTIEIVGGLVVIACCIRVGHIASPLPHRKSKYFKNASL